MKDDVLKRIIEECKEEAKNIEQYMQKPLKNIQSMSVSTMGRFIAISKICEGALLMEKKEAE